MSILEDVMNLKKKLEELDAADDVEESNVEDMMKALKLVPMSVDVLKKSKIGVTLNTYRQKYRKSKIGKLAKELRDSWMKMWDDKVEKKKVKKSSNGLQEAGKFHGKEINGESPPYGSSLQTSHGIVAVMKGIMCLTQRARFDITISTTSLRFVGKSLDQEILLETVHNIYLLPQEDKGQYYFVIELYTPIIKGKTKYPCLVFTLNKKVLVTQELFMNQDELDTRYNGRLKRHMQGLEPDIVSSIVEAVVNKKLITMVLYKGSLKSHSIPCVNKSDSGVLYLLEDRVVFLPKPSLCIDLDQISSVEFDRSGGNSRTFDFSIKTRPKKHHTFSIEKGVYNIVMNFVKESGL